MKEAMEKKYYPPKGTQFSGAKIPEKPNPTKPEKVPESITIMRPISGGIFEENEEVVLKKTTRKIPKFEQVKAGGQIGPKYKKK